MLRMSRLMTGGGSTPNHFAGLGGAPGAFGGAANLPSFPNITTNATNPGQTQSPTDATDTPSTTGSLPPNPFFDPAMMQQLMGAWGNQGGAGLGGGLFGAPATSAPTDTRPPEERFEAQLEVRIPQKLAHMLVNDTPNHP
jgi:ubiquilin